MMKKIGLIIVLLFMFVVLAEDHLSLQVNAQTSNVAITEISNISSPLVLNTIGQSTINQPNNSETITVFGQEIDVGNLPLFLSTFIIAFVDGFNPCSLWVLTFLLGMVVMTGSRKRILLVGITYLTVASAMYGLFILGLINFLSYITYLLWIRIVVALIASLFAIVNIKDFFFYKKGLSFTIPDSYKPKIYRQARDLRKESVSTWQLMTGAAVMALGITLVELPCTAGFPMIWSSIMSTHTLDTGTFTMLFLLYILVYLLDELIIFFSVVFTLKASKFEEKHGRFLKLLGGIIMLALAAVLVFNPILLNDIGGTLVVFASSVVLSIIIAKVYEHQQKKAEK